MAINEDTGFAYIVGSDECAGGLHMVDISDPVNPTFAGCFGDHGYTHDTQCVTYAGPDAMTHCPADALDLPGGDEYADGLTLTTRQPSNLLAPDARSRHVVSVGRG